MGDRGVSGPSLSQPRQRPDRPVTVFGRLLHPKASNAKVTRSLLAKHERYAGQIEELHTSSRGQVALQRKHHIWFGLQGRRDKPMQLSTPFTRRAFQAVLAVLSLLLFAGAYASFMLPSRAPFGLFVLILGLLNTYFTFLLTVGTRTLMRCSINRSGRVQTKVFFGSMLGFYQAATFDHEPRLEIVGPIRTTLHRWHGAHGSSEWDAYIVYATIGPYSTVLQVRRSRVDAMQWLVNYQERLNTVLLSRSS